MKSSKLKSLQEVQIQKWKKAELVPKADVLAVEEPLEINIAYGLGDDRQRKSLAVTMRTPGQDFDLALGFLLSEGIISQQEEVLQIRYLASELEDSAQENVLLVDLVPKHTFDPEQLNRHFYTASSCGICGKASIDLVRVHLPYILSYSQPKIAIEELLALPEKLLKAQESFAKTGGLHAAALFNQKGELLLIREDVGRHNALDKIIGAAFQKGWLPLNNHILMLSGRISFELVQKALVAGIPAIAAVGAPSSLALELADEHKMTLIGFLKEGQFNIYCGVERILQ